MKRIVAVVILSVLCAGCSNIALGPDRVYSVDEQVAYLRNQEPPYPQTAQDLNDYVTRRMFEIDLEYSVYFAKITRDSQLSSLAGDSVLLTLTALSTVAPASAVAYKTAYSAAATGVAGFKAGVDKDVLLSHTVQILQSQMETSRSSIRDRITDRLNGAMKPYTVWQAMSDLEDYYVAGTIPGALEALSAATSSNSQKGKDLKNLRTQSFRPVSVVTKNIDGARICSLAAP